MDSFGDGPLSNDRHDLSVPNVLVSFSKLVVAQGEGWGSRKAQVFV